MGLLENDILRNLFFLPIFIMSFMKGVLILVAVLIFKGPSWVFRKKKRDVRPDCLNNPALGTHKLIKINDLTLHVVESGDTKNPLMLFIHGFPECWYSWRHQIREFNKEYHCVAFDMRGVGESEAPLELDHYTLDKLTADVRELIKAVGHTSCVLVAHDWGGKVAWDFAARYPDMVDTYIAMNIPHPDRFAEVYTSLISQIWSSWYFFFFQLPYLPELMMSMGDYFSIEAACKKGPSTEEDIEAFKYAISQPGRTTTFINYYRNILGNLLSETGKVSSPTLLIWGTEDPAFHIKVSEETEKFCPKFTLEKIEGGDHFIQQDKPYIVNVLMRNYLKK